MTKRSADGGRAKVIEAARSLFQECGFHQTRMAELSERAGVSVGQIYRLFASKAEMIAAIIAEDTDARIARLEQIHQAVVSGACSAREGLRTAALDALNQGEQALTFEILAEGFRNPEIGEEIGDLCDRYRAILREIILSAEASIEGDRLAAAEEMLLAILFGLGNRTLSRPPLSAEVTADYAADMVLAMLR
jgi:TetR/AcrR family transcriptional regulator, repressor for uid operon